MKTYLWSNLANSKRKFIRSSSSEILPLWCSSKYEAIFVSISRLSSFNSIRHYSGPSFPPSAHCLRAHAYVMQCQRYCCVAVPTPCRLWNLETFKHKSDPVHNGTPLSCMTGQQTAFEKGFHSFPNRRKIGEKRKFLKRLQHWTMSFAKLEP